MNFNELLKDNSLFGTINSIKEFPFITSYGAEKIDLLYKMLYGSRIIPSNVENMSIQDIANVIVVSFGDKWEKQYKLLTDELLAGVESKTVIEESTEDDTDRNLTTTTINKVSAFNEDELTENDGDDEKSNLNETKKSTRNSTNTTTSMKAIKDQLELLTSNFIIDVVMKDVSQLLSLSIY